MRSSIRLGILVVVVLLSASPARAHQSGCHRWHSCPSDTGSYVCGDAGYTCRYPTYDTNPMDGGPASFDLNREPIVAEPEESDDESGVPWGWIAAGAAGWGIISWIRDDESA